MAQSVSDGITPEMGGVKSGDRLLLRLPAWLMLVCMVTFSVLLWAGAVIAREAPPIPLVIESPQHQVLLTREDIQAGQVAYLARGGQDIGSIWGHGSYLAPDWTADVLHRWGLATAGMIRDHNSDFDQQDWEALSEGERASLQATLRDQFKTNRYDPTNQSLALSEEQSRALEKVIADYQQWLAQGSVVHSIPKGWIVDPIESRQITAFFSWTAWAAAASRPGAPFSYTANFPHDPLVGNQPPTQFVIWSIVSVIVLIAAIAAFLLVYLLQEDPNAVQPVPCRPSIRLASPSQKLTALFFAVAMGLFLLQILMGMATAHDAVEGDGFFGLPLQQLLPYAASRSWHLQSALFWIATCWLAEGLYFAPRFGGYEPKGQVWGTGALLTLLAVVVLGALIGTWAAVMRPLGGQSFWLGHQGYEYLELGRLWQLLLVVAMVFWLWLVLRALRPALQREQSQYGLSHFYLYSAISIPLFYAAGLMYNNHTHLSVAEYWRWWVVHLWVEGFFEVFATVTIATLCSELGLLKASSALRATILTTILYLGSGVLGTLHHLYFAGTPVFIAAIGAVASALEVVPLTLVGFEVVKGLQLSKEAEGFYRMPLKFFLATCGWNLIGAGVFGFLINPPIVLYYSQGLNTTPIHAHSALFGVYGNLAIALMLFVLREITLDHAWNERLFDYAWWAINGGLAAMLILGLIPNGFYQLVQSVNHGTWYARSAEVVSSPWMRTTVWLRMPGDIMFSLGALLLALCVGRALLSVLKQPSLKPHQLAAERQV